MIKTFQCRNCRRSLELDAFETRSNKNGNPYRAHKCKECTLARKRVANNEKIERYFARICVNQRYNHKKGYRGKTPDGFLLTPDDLMQIWERQDGKCAYSGILMTSHRDGVSRVDLNASLDRRDPTAGYTLDNVHLVCDRVNTMKHTLDEDMFIWWVKNIADHLLAK